MVSLAKSFSIVKILVASSITSLRPYDNTQHEYVPPELVRAAFIMLYKNKGSPDDPSKYRCIGLLPHVYKILSPVMLERIDNECSQYLSDWQAGFRPERSCRDNILLLLVLFEQAILSQ